MQVGYGHGVGTVDGWVVVCCGSYHVYGLYLYGSYEHGSVGSAEVYTLMHSMSISDVHKQYIEVIILNYCIKVQL